MMNLLKKFFELLRPGLQDLTSKEIGQKHSVVDGLEGKSIDSFMLTEYQVLKDFFIHNEEGMDRTMDFFLTALTFGTGGIILLYQVVDELRVFLLGCMILLAILFLVSEITRWRLHGAILRYANTTRSLNAIKVYFSSKGPELKPYLYYWRHDDTYSGYWSQENRRNSAIIWFSIFKPAYVPILLINTLLVMGVTICLIYFLETTFHWNFYVSFLILLVCMVGILNLLRQIITGRHYINRAILGSRITLSERTLN